MPVTIHEAEAVTVIAPEGRIMLGAGEAAVREAVHEALEAGVRKIVIDLGRVTFLDSFGVGTLIDCYMTVRERGGVLKLCAVPPRVTSILQITKLNTVFEVYKSEAEALTSF